MKRLMVAAIAVLLPLGVAFAAGPYDGTWTGPLKGSGTHCPPGAITLRVADGRIAGNIQLSNGTVRSWAAPATGIGMALTNTLHAVGMHSIGLSGVLSVTRFIGLMIAVGFTLWLLWHGPKRGWVRSLGLALVLFVELGPVLLIAVAVAVLGGVLLVPMGRWTQWSWPEFQGELSP